ncbi:DNA-binding LacI/PurR family transcriptional regulator [Aeribacillus sp. SP014]
MVRISDVAKMANVSTATVSRVLSNSGNVKKETAEKVLEAINKAELSTKFIGSTAETLRNKNGSCCSA